MKPKNVILSIIILFISFSAVKAQSPLPRVTFTLVTANDTLFVGLRTDADSTLVYFYREDSLGNAIDTLMQIFTKHEKFTIPMISKRITIAGEISYLCNTDIESRNFSNILSVNASNHTTLSELCLQSLSPVNEIPFVDVSNCLALKILRLYYSSLTFQSIKLDGCKNLESFSCLDNLQLDSLDVSFCDSLKYLHADNNSLKYVKLNDSIEKVNCRNNQLTHLQVEGLQKLMTLSIEDNFFTSLELIDNPSFQALWASNNQLQYLKVDSLPKMLRLSINNNSLTDLDIRGNTSLHTIECYGNPLGACALDSIFKTLPDWNGWNQGKIYIANDTIECLGSSSCHSDIATARNWKVLDKNGSSAYTGDGTGCCSHIIAKNLQAIPITTHNVQISWTDSSFHQLWEMAVQKEETTPTYKTIVGSVNSFMLNGLPPNTTYYICLRPICQDGAQWSDTISFTTGPDVGIKNIVLPTLDTCRSPDELVFIEVILSNQTPSDISDLAIHAIIDSAGQILYHLHDKVELLPIGTANFFTFNVPYAVPYMPENNKEYEVKVYIDAQMGDHFHTNDTFSIQACVDYVNVKEVLVSSADNIRLSPNPSSDFIFLQTKEIEKENTLLEIYNLHGKLLYTQRIIDETTSIDISSYAEGMYFFKILNNQQLIKIVKVIINR
ncbi:MAG: T9SS type A sorting domain-containing protein [Bacteroidales bacterium]|jgi:hypothetical protein